MPDINVFCRNCGRKNVSGAEFCTKCGAPLIPIHPDPARMPVKDAGGRLLLDAYAKKPAGNRKPGGKGNSERCPSQVNWIGIIGFVLAMTGLVLAFAAPSAGSLYLYFAVIGLLVSLVGLSLRRNRRLRGFAIAGCAVSAFTISFIALIILAIVLVCSAVFRRARRY
ncbi:MAG: zinc ribbon domain-containing protein [Clostridia bacterium]|nr:zinc ribbon domain-containing protein [Clostridia bacterium]